MRIVIEGHDLPGRGFDSAGVRMENVHVGVQLGRHPVAVESDGQLVAVIALTDARGGPVCARVRPPAIRWRVA